MYQSGDDWGWEEVQETAQGLIAFKDMNRFKKLCGHREGYRYVEANEEEDIYGEWERYVLNGETKYCGVLIGHKTQGEDEEEENSDNENRGGYHLVDQGHKYYLAFHQWSAFAGWLESHMPEERGMVHKFEVRW